MREIFAGRGASVVEAASADEAMEAVERAAEPFQLVFADCSRPDAGGLELARRIGADAAKAPGLTVATVSSYDLSKAFIGLREAGLEHYVVKPLKRADLLGAAADFARRAPEAAGPAAGSAAAATGGALDQSAHFEQSGPSVLDGAAGAAAQPVLMIAGQEVAPCRILLADDSLDNRLLIRAYLGKTGYGLDEAENGQVAIDKLLSGRYDLVLMDIQMPVMDGFTAVRRIRQWEREHSARRTPIIALTASTFDETVRKAVEAGCDSHLGKPLKRSTLLRVIRETALANRQAPAAA
jgi:two-component system, sensor histidine kinase and response regulator